MVSLSNGCLKNDCICRSFRARHRTENFERHVRSDQTSFWLLQTKKREKKKITYSKVIMPKQVGLIIPRGPFLNLEWFVGLLKGDNWIHTELAAGMHTQSAAECECSRPGIVSPPWDLHVQIPMPMHNATQVAAVKRPRPSWDRQLSHASFSASTAASHIPLREPLECACEFACLHVSVSNYLSGSWKEMRCVCWTADFSRRLSRAVLHARVHARVCFWEFINRVPNCEKVNTDVGPLPGH